MQLRMERSYLVLNSKLGQSSKVKDANVDVLDFVQSRASSTVTCTSREKKWKRRIGFRGSSSSVRKRKIAKKRADNRAILQECESVHSARCYYSSTTLGHTHTHRDIPGATKTCWTRSDWASFQAMVCSRPPFPSKRTISLSMARVIDVGRGQRVVFGKAGKTAAEEIAEGVSGGENEGRAG